LAIFLAVPAFWTGVALFGAVLFPTSSMRALPIVGIGAALLWRDWIVAARRAGALPSTTAGVAAAGVVIGVAAAWSQRGADPDTHPRNDAAPSLAGDDPGLPTGLIPLGDDGAIQTTDGAVSWRRGQLRVVARSLLTFESRSPDRCWTVFAPPSERVAPPRALASVRRGPRSVMFSFNDADDQSLTEVVTLNDGRLSIDAFSVLRAPVYSHLNTFAELSVQGHHQLALSFSPCPDVRVEVTNFDYPFGRPMRLAYVDANETFHVVEASSGEKGPFRELGRGDLPRSLPLTLTLHDDGLPICRIALSDWAYQAGKALSPTAGWGLPVNAIEFGLSGDDPASAASIWLTLAGTGVGRGWDSVGHAAGTYRNRISIEWAK
jgi:hypothetical protein